MGTHLDEEDGSEDGTPVPQDPEEVVQRGWEVLCSDNGDGDVDGCCKDGEDEAGKPGEEGEDNLEGQGECVRRRSVVRCNCTSVLTTSIVNV